MHPDEINVFDFDGTLITVNSFKELNKKLLIFLLIKLRLISFTRLIFYYVVRKLGYFSHLQFKKLAVRVFEDSLSEYEKKNIAQEIFDLNKNQNIYDIMINSVNVILSTASPYSFISRINFNIDNLIYICSLNYESDFPDQSNFGDGKIKNIQWLLKNENILIKNFYTDSFDDKPMIDYSMNAFMIQNKLPMKIK